MPRIMFNQRMPKQSGLSGLGFGNQSRGRGGFKIRLVIAAGIAIFAIISWLSAAQTNAVTGESQRVAMSKDEEIALGLHAAPQMIQQHGGLEPSPRDQTHVDQIGARLLKAVDKWIEIKNQKEGSNLKNPYPFEFHLLADSKTINAFALPGGQVFMTDALYSKLKTEGQIAGVIGHEIGHVLSRHGAIRMANQQLTQKLILAAGSASGSQSTAQMAAMVGQVINMKYGREDELESDAWGIRLMLLAGYDPNSMLGVMDVLEAASAGGPPEIMSTHPKPANRKKYIQQVIAEVISKEFGGQMPRGLQK